MEKQSPGSGSRRSRRDARRFAVGLNSLVVLLLAAALLAMLNYLSFRHYFRADWSRTRFYALSGKTLNLLGEITNRIDVTVFFRPVEDVYEDISNLLKEYQYASPHLHVEWVDPERDLARTEELTRKYGLENPNVVVLDAGGRTKTVGALDILEYDFEPIQRGQPPVVKGFKGEQGLSSAIESITQTKRPVVYFLQGHGERDIGSFDRVGGYSSIAQAIRLDNVEVRSLVLGESAGIPRDCDALLIAGPEKEIPGQDVSMIRDYLERKGRLLVLVDAMVRTGLEPLLDDWGIELGDDVVIDGTRTRSGRELFITQYEPHPITRPLQNIKSIFYLPRSVEPRRGTGGEGESADRPHVLPLASSTVSGWAETDLTENPMRYDADRDRPGPISIAVAAERGNVPGIDLQIQPTRVVVFGDSDFVANGVMSGGNADFFLGALNWLLQRETLLAISPKPVEETRILMTRAELQGLFWVVVCGLPGVIAIIGGFVWLRRRS